MLNSLKTRKAQLKLTTKIRVPIRQEIFSSLFVQISSETHPMARKCSFTRNKAAAAWSGPTKPLSHVCTSSRHRKNVTFCLIWCRCDFGWMIARIRNWVTVWLAGGLPWPPHGLKVTCHTQLPRPAALSHCASGDLTHRDNGLLLKYRTGSRRRKAHYYWALPQGWTNFSFTNY
jgi:hypothetical protein